jgi:hypothetical protein
VRRATITSLVPVPGAAGVAGLALTFSEPMNAARAANVGNYADFITTPGADGVIGTWDDGSIAISAVVYKAAQQQAVLIFKAPLPFGTFAQVVLNRDAGIVPGRGLTDLAGNLLDGTGTGRSPGTPCVTSFAAGRVLRYTDSAGDAVTLTLSGAGSGMMALQRNAAGDAQVLRIIGATAPGTLTGSVLGPIIGRRRVAPSTVVIPTIAGTAGISVRLGAPFRVGGISATAVVRKP